MKKPTSRMFFALGFFGLLISCGDGADKAPISYTDGFVDAMERGLRFVEKQDRETAVPGPCDWSKAQVPDPTKPYYQAFARSQRLKYEVALIGHGLYREAEQAARSSAAGSAEDQKFRFLNYILGLSGYWEIAAARHEDKLLTFACEGVVRDWRDGTVVGARKEFAALTSAMGDVLLGALTADFHRLGNTQTAFLFGAYQEAGAQFGVENSVSGWFYDTSLDPRGPIGWTSEPPYPLCEHGETSTEPCVRSRQPQSYIPQMVWLTLPVDILLYTGEPTAENLEVEERGRKYMEEFEDGSGGRVSLLATTSEMLKYANSRIEPRRDLTPEEKRLERWLERWLEQNAMPLLDELLEDFAPVPPAVSPQEEFMAMGIRLADQVLRDLSTFPETGQVDPMVRTESPIPGAPPIDICDLYRFDNGIAELLLSWRFSCAQPE